MDARTRGENAAPPTDGNPGGRDLSGLIEQHSRWLRTVIYARLREPQAVEEVLQEVGLALVRGRSLPDDDARVAPWLYRVAIRQTLLYRRKMGRRRKLQDRYTEAAPPKEHDPASPDPLHFLLAEERRKLVREAMKRLNARDAEMLLLKYTENWSYHQIAEHLGISHSAVESRLHRARARLRTELIGLNVIEPSWRSAG
jgi:RNA polymerase sigma factor (sigma-70 family)